MLRAVGLQVGYGRFLVLCFALLTLGVESGIVTVLARLVAPRGLFVCKSHALRSIAPLNEKQALPRSKNELLYILRHTSPPARENHMGKRALLCAPCAGPVDSIAGHAG